MLAGRFAAAEALGETFTPPPVTTALGALIDHITGGADDETFQPMNVNFGLVPPLGFRVKGRERKKAYTDRALADLQAWQSTSLAEE